jgi:thiamine phosphate synthase YjbQ (UPF0047 family)
MQIPAATFVYCHTRLGILTEHSADVVDLTEGIGSLLAEAALTRGVLNLRSFDRGTGIVVASGEAPAAPDAATTPAGACLSIVDGRLEIGAHERVLLVDRDGPGAREIAVVIIGERRP